MQKGTCVDYNFVREIFVLRLSVVIGLVDGVAVVKNDDSCPERSVRTFVMRRVIVGIVVLLVAAIANMPANAQAMDDESDLESVPVNLVTPGGDSEILPPLPEFRPLIGPIVKHWYSWDVDRRTTAFIPGNMDHLTPIEFPDTEGKWIRVDLSEQTVVAYQGDRPVRGFIISSGLPRTPTVTGAYRIRVKVSSQNMTGGDRAADNYYDLDNVQWVQYFFEDYSFHGTYWHNDFGRPHSHGCLNMTIADAKWLFDWASPTWDGHTTWYGSTEADPGTLVIIHE